jgi:hypothetical protein
MFNIPFVAAGRRLRVKMLITTMMSLVGAGVAGAASAWNRQWLPAMVWFFSLAYTIFDKVYPSVLPEPVVTGFAFISLVLALLFCWQVFSRKRNRSRSVGQP